MLWQLFSRAELPWALCAVQPVLADAELLKKWEFYSSPLASKFQNSSSEVVNHQKVFGLIDRGASSCESMNSMFFLFFFLFRFYEMNFIFIIKLLERCTVHLWRLCQYDSLAMLGAFPMAFRCGIHQNFFFV